MPFATQMKSIQKYFLLINQINYMGKGNTALNSKIIVLHYSLNPTIDKFFLHVTLPYMKLTFLTNLK